MSDAAPGRAPARRASDARQLGRDGRRPRFRPPPATRRGTVNDYTRQESFDEAALVATSLGEPDGERTTVLADPFGVRPGDWLTRADVEACLAAQPD